MKKLFFILTVFVLSVFGAIAAYAAGWESDGTGWRYLKDDGSYCKNEWVQEGGAWYYFNDDGYMVTNQWVGNYYLGSSGAMLTNTITPDGHKVDIYGAWVPGIKVDMHNGTFALFCFNMKPGTLGSSIVVHADSIELDGCFYTYKNLYFKTLLGDLKMNYQTSANTMYRIYPVRHFDEIKKGVTREEFANASKKSESATIIIKVTNQQVEEIIMNVSSE